MLYVQKNLSLYIVGFHKKNVTLEKSFLYGAVIWFSVPDDTSIAQREFSADHFAAGISFKGGEPFISDSTHDPHMTNVHFRCSVAPAEINIGPGSGDISFFFLCQGSGKGVDSRIGIDHSCLVRGVLEIEATAVLVINEPHNANAAVSRIGNHGFRHVGMHR